MSEENQSEHNRQTILDLRDQISKLELARIGGEETVLEQKVEELGKVAAQADLLSKIVPLALTFIVTFAGYFIFDEIREIKAWQRNWERSGELPLDVKQNERIGEIQEDVERLIKRSDDLRNKANLLKMNIIELHPNRSFTIPDHLYLDERQGF